MPLFTEPKTEEKEKQTRINQLYGNELNEIYNRRETEYRQRQEEEALYVKNLYSPERIKEWKSQGTLSPIDVFKKKNKWELLPYVGTVTQGKNAFDIKTVSDKMKRGEQITPEERAKFEEFVLDMGEIQTRGYSFLGGAVNLGLETLPFMVEFGAGLLTSGGTASFGAALTRKGAQAAVKTLKQTIKKELTEKTAGELTKDVLKGTGKTIYNTAFNPRTYAFTATRLPQQVYARLGDIRLSDSLVVSPEGYAILKEAEERPAISFMKALGLVNIETASEISGSMLVRPAMHLMARVTGLRALKNMVSNRLPENFIKLTQKVTGMPFMKAVQQLGYDGILEEMGEERVGDLLKVSFNLDDEEGYSFEQFLDAAFPPPKELAQEALSFGITGIGMNTAHAGLKKLPAGLGEKYTKDDFLVDAGIFRVPGYDAYIDKKLKQSLYKEGKSDEEIENAVNFATRDQKIEYLKNTQVPIDTEEEFNEKDARLAKRKAEVEEQFYNKLIQGEKDTVLASAEAQNLASYFVESIPDDENAQAALDQWINKLSVRYNIPAEGNSLSQSKYAPKTIQKAQEVKSALQKIAQGSEEETVADLRNDLEQYGGTNDVTFIFGDEKKGIQHIAQKHGVKTLLGVFDAVVDGKVSKFVKNKKTVHIEKNGIEAVLSLDENGNRKTWLLTGWNKKTSSGEKEQVSANSNSTQIKPTFSRQDLGAELDNIITNNGENVNPDIYYQSAESAGAGINEIEQAKKEWEEKGVLSKYFKKWFGDSKVVNEQGQPLVVYHNTNAEFDTFDEEKQNKGFFGKGFYFSNNEKFSNHYGKNTMPVYLKITKPYLNGNSKDLRNPEFLKNLKRAGYDGIIKTFSDGTATYVVFGPEQIKSVNNKGTFNSSHPNIYYQTGNENIDRSVIYNNLPQELKEAVDFIYNGKAVYEIEGNEFEKNGQNLNQRIYNYYKENFNNIVNVEDIGDVILDKRSIKDSIYHGISSDKVNAFAAVPYVLMNGKKANTVNNYKEKDETRYLFVAPIKLKGEDYFCEVVVKKGPDKQAFYLHEVELTKKLSDVFSTAQHGTSDNSKSIIANLIKKFNPDVKIYYQSDNADTNNETGITEPLDLADTNEDYEKLIAGFTQQEVLNKIVSILEEIENTPDEKTKLNLMKKNNILEDVLSASENQIKFHDAREREDLYLNAYYIMKNQEIPESYIDTTAKSQQAYSDLKKLHDKKKEKAQEEYLGYFTEGKEKTLITIMSNHDKSTILHECGHLFLNGLNELASVSPKIKADLEKVNKWLGADGTGEYTVKQQEKFARSYEAYLYKGKAPNSALKRAFEKFKEWLKSAYLNINNLADKGADISDEAHELFTEMFAGDSCVEDRKAADELLKTIKTKAKKARKNNPLDRELDEVEKRHKDVSYEILSAATGKSVKYLKTVFETDSEKHGLGKKRENVQELLDDVDDKITVSGGLRKEWSEFYSDTGVNYETEDLGGDYKLVMQAYETILNKSYRNPAKDILSEAEERALYFEKAVDNADREYRLILREYKNGNRNAALAAFYDWCDALDEEIREDYEDRFIYDTAMIERNENTAVYDKAKRKIMQKARELDNQLSINKNEKYKELVKETVKDLSFLNPYDKARLTANILDVPSTEFLISSLDNIMDIAQTMEDVRYRRELERKIHVELKGTKNYKKNGRTVGKYDYRSNKIFEALRSYEKLSQDAANDLLLKESHFAEGEDNGLTYKNKLINMYLSYKAGGRTYTDTEMMKKIYDEIIRIKLIGKSAKSELELIEKLEGDKDVDELIDIVEARPKKINILKKAYINGMANLESTINAVFGKDIMTKYATEILYAETQAQAWQYQQKKKFTDSVAEICNLPKWNWDFQILKYLSEKHVYQEIRRKYDKDETVKTRLIDREMTHMDIICAYIWSKNAVLEKRLINQFGEETLNNMFDELSLEDVKLAELMMNTAQSFYPAVNRAFINKYGLDLPKVSCYFPSTPERGSEIDLYNEYSAKSLNNSFTKARANTENLPMDFHNPVEILFNHIEGVAKFTFMSNSLDKANLRFRNADLKRAIINKYGKAVYQTLEQELINITYKKEAPVFSGTGKVFDNMIGNWITGNIAIKPVVGLKQLLSATNYSVDMPVTDWTAGFVKSLADFKNTIDYMMKIPYINARFHGNYSNEFLKQTIENSAFAASQKLKDACTLFVKIGDIGAIIFGGKPYIDYLITKKGMTEEEAIKQFIISTNRSQQSSLVSSLSNFQVAMTRNPFGKLFIAFKNAPQQYIRMCGDAIISCKNGDMSKTRLAKTLFQFGYLQPFLYTLATSGALLRFLFTGDPDDVIKDFKMSFFDLNSSAIPFFGEVYKYTVNRLSDDGKYLPQSTPLLGDIEREINRLSKEDVTLKDIAESLSYMSLHIGLGYNGKALINTGSGIGDIFTGSPVQGAMKLFGYTNKRAKRIAGSSGS